MKKIMILIALSVFPFAAYAAGEEDLYAPVPPADSAFVRAFNATGDDLKPVQIDGLGLPAGPTGSISDYAVVKQGDRSLAYGGKTQTVKIEAQQYYTIYAPKDGEAKVLKDARIENPAKAFIYFYNFSDAPAVLTAPSHKATIFENVAPGANVSRDINAVTLDLAVKVKDADVATLSKVELKRQAGASVFVTGQNGQYKAFSVTNKVRP